MAFLLRKSTVYQVIKSSTCFEAGSVLQCVAAVKEDNGRVVMARPMARLTTVINVRSSTDRVCAS